MKYASAMGEIDCAGDGLENGDRRLGFQRPLEPDSLAETRALEVLHHQIREAALPRVDAEIRDVDDVGVLEPSEGFRFKAETAQKHRVVPTAGLDDLDGEVALKGEVTGPIDEAHSTFTQASIDTVLSVEDTISGKPGCQRSPIRRANPLVVIEAKRAQLTLFHGAVPGLDRILYRLEGALCHDLPHGVLRLYAGEELLASSAGQQRRIQAQLRSCGFLLEQAEAVGLENLDDVDPRFRIGFPVQSDTARGVALDLDGQWAVRAAADEGLDWRRRWAKPLPGPPELRRRAPPRPPTLASSTRDPARRFHRLTVQ